MADVCLGLIVVGLTAYAVLGSADFGAGLWDLVAGGALRGGRIRGLIQHSMAPVWEANHLWLIYVLVVTWSAFPRVFASVFSTLSIPLFAAGIGIIFRGAAFALRGQAATIRDARTLGALFALSSVLIPFSLGTVVGAIASGRVPVGNAVGDPVASWLNPTSIFLGTLAVLAGGYLAAVFLAADAVRLRQADLVRAFRARALAMGVATGAVAIGGLLVVRSDARPIFDGLTSGRGLAMVLASGVAGIATLGLTYGGRYGLARVSAAGAVAAITVGWFFAQHPYMLPPRLTVDEAAASDATLAAVLVALGGGMLLVLPALGLLYRLVLRGRLDQGFEPLDQRFRPLTAGDEPESER